MKRFRESRLDHFFGNTIAGAAVAVPPFVLGEWGLIHSLVVVNLLLVLSLLRTPDPFRRAAALNTTTGELP
jgi:hypothetical protein